MQLGHVALLSMSDITAEGPDATPDMTIEATEDDQQSGVAQAIDAVAALSRRTVGTAAAAGAATASAVGAGATSTAEAGAAAARTVGAGAMTAATATANAGLEAARTVGRGAKSAVDVATSRAVQAMSAAQALLATDLASQLNELVAAAVEGSASIYDKAMDANYLDPMLRPGLGGSNHRLFDGGHTIVGAVKAAHNASPDDTLLQEALGTIEALFRDVSTPRGLPLATWDKSTFDAVAGSLQTNFGIPKSWFYELNTYDAGDLFGGAVGVVSLFFGWNRASTETFAQLASGMALSAAVSTNPLLMLVSVVSLGRAFHKARSTDEYSDLLDGGIKGAVSSGASLAAVALVSSLGGPAGVALLVGISAGILACAATKKLSVAVVADFVTNRAAAAVRAFTNQAVVAGDVVFDGALVTGRLVASQATAVGRSAADQTSALASKAGAMVQRGEESAGRQVDEIQSAGGRMVDADSPESSAEDPMGTSAERAEPFTLGLGNSEHSAPPT